MYRAQEVGESSQLYRLVEKLTQNAGLPMPKVYTIPSETPNAFATGRNPRHAAVAVTEGALRMLSTEELAGVIGHELAHVQHRDILISTIAATLAGAIMWLASMARWAAIFGGIGGDDEDRGGGIFGLIFLAIVAPIAAILIQLAIARSREYAADKEGAQIAGNPLYLANALERLHSGVQRRPMVRANAATSHLFIVNPLKGGAIAKLFSTHPPVEERIKRLRQMT
jgi:heat shock protein HtpX